MKKLLLIGLLSISCPAYSTQTGIDLFNKGLENLVDAMNAPQRRAAEQHRQMQINEYQRLQREQLELEKEKLRLEQERLAMQRQQQSSAGSNYIYSKNWHDSTMVVSLQNQSLAGISVDNTGQGYNQVYMLMSNQNCQTETAIFDEISAAFINGKKVSFRGKCTAQNEMMIWGADYTQASIITNAFIKSKYVKFQFGSYLQTFSASGFARTWSSIRS